MTYELYTDGAARKGVGTFAYVLAKREGSGAAEAINVYSSVVVGADSLQMEMMAIVAGLQYAFARRLSVTVVTDCGAIINPIRQGWPDHWRKNDWRNTRGKKVAHVDLWESLWLTLHAMAANHIDVQWFYVRGHGRGGIVDAPYRVGNALADAACGDRIREYLDENGRTRKTCQ